MLVDFEYTMGKLYVSYIGGDGRLKMKQYPWKDPAQFEVASPGEKGEPGFQTWDGKPVVKRSVRTPNRYAVADFMDSLPAADQAEIFDFQEPKIYFMDIETEVVDGFPEAVEAATRVLNVAIVCDQKVLVMGLQPLDTDTEGKLQTDTNKYFEKFGKNYQVKYLSFATEYAMLHAIFNKYIPLMPVLTGWNFVEYDWVYLCNRARNMGININVASPTGKLQKVWSKNLEKPKNAELPMHRVVVDYMELYSKWDTSVKIKESTSLDFVSSKVLGTKKLTYEGTIQQMHDNDYYKYTLYNIIDTILVQLIHERNKYISIMLGVSELCRVRMVDAYSTIRTTEGVLRRNMREKLGIVFVRNIADDENDSNGEAVATKLLEGGWVKDPVTGMNMWVAVLDFASLYPTTMRQNNIAPESFKGMKINAHQCIYQGNVREIDPTDIVVVSGAVFRNENSVTKQTLTDVYFGRTEYKGKMKVANIELNEVKVELSDVEDELILRGLLKSKSEK